MQEQWDRVRPGILESPWVLDGLLAVSLTALSLGAFFASERTPEHPSGPDALGAVLVAAATMSLVFRRRFTLAVFVVAAAATAAVYVLGYPESGLPMVVLIALYTVAVRCDRRITVASTAALLLVVVFVVADANDMDAGTLVGTLAVFVTAAVVGDRKKVQEAYSEQLELRAAAKERERIEAERRALDEERIRIAREMHDVVAHSMSVVAVQSGVGAHVIDSRPEEAKRILETIGRTSREGLDEMRRLLGVLRAGPDGAGGRAELSPAPGLRALDELVSRVVEAGVAVAIDVQGEGEAIPPGVDLAAYRIVQEALTNVLKHAGGTRARVFVRYEPGAVHLEVVDDGAGTTGGSVNGTGPGHGLVGIRERAALYGGELEAGPRPEGGYRVATTLRYAP